MQAQTTEHRLPSGEVQSDDGESTAQNVDDQLSLNLSQHTEDDQWRPEDENILEDEPAVNVQPEQHPACNYPEAALRLDMRDEINMPLTSSSSEDESDSSSDEDENTRSSSSEDGSGNDSSEQEDIESSEEDAETSAGNQKVYEGCSLSVDEAVLSLMDLFVDRKLEKVTLGAQLKCVLKFLPRLNCMPKTLDSLLKYVESFCPLPTEVVHYYCSKCLYYIGEEEKSCQICKSVECHKFYQLSIEHQIRNLFENHGLADEIDKFSAARSASSKPGHVNDLLDGSVIAKAILPGKYDLVLLGHTDGVSISDSSNCSLWPMEFVICQLPPHIRYKFVLVCGVWVDSCKPYMNSYMKPFTKEIVRINEHGVKWIHPVSKEENVTRVTVPALSVDAPVRAQVQNILAPGGKCACNVCEQKTLKLPAEEILPGVEKKKRRRVFTFQEEVQLRTGIRMGAQAKQTKLNEEMNRRKKKDPVKGVKGISVISQMPGCDIGTAVFPEYMHLLLYLIKHFFCLWFETDGPWSLQKHRDVINSFLLKVKVPDYITRIPRSTDCYLQWKANELRTFVLYLSPVIFAKCMLPNYFQHWLLFVQSLYLLLQESVSERDIARAEIMLKMFLRDFEKLYKADHSTYYLHNVRHLPLVVQRYGPLWSNATFMLEGFNGSLRRFIHGTKNQGQELINNIKLACGVQILRARVADRGCRSVTKTVELRNQVKGYQFSDRELELLALNDIMNPVRVFHRCVIGREKFTSSMYTRQKKRNNYTVCFLNAKGVKEFGEVSYYCEDTASVKVAVAKVFAVDHSKVFCHDSTSTVVEHIIPIKETNKLVVVPVDRLLFKTIRVEQFVCLRPNSHEVNL